MLEVVSTLLGRRASYADLDAQRVQVGSRARPWPSEAARAVSPLEHRVATMVSAPRTGLCRVAASPSTRRLLGLQRGLDSDVPTAWTGLMSPTLLDVPGLDGAPLEPGKIAKFIVSPGAYLVEEVLAIRSPARLYGRSDPLRPSFQERMILDALGEALDAGGPTIPMFEVAWERAMAKWREHRDDVDDEMVELLRGLARQRVGKLERVGALPQGVRGRVTGCVVPGLAWAVETDIGWCVGSELAQLRRARPRARAARPRRNGARAQRDGPTGDRQTASDRSRRGDGRERGGSRGCARRPEAGLRQPVCDAGQLVAVGLKASAAAHGRARRRLQPRGGPARHAEEADVKAQDHGIRDRAIRELGRSIALSAGAGSGKTSVLTQRVLELMVQGTPASRVAAITFTEKAAGELQARVRDALEHRLAAGLHVPAGLLADLSSLELSTIHGFCKHLLTAESFDAAWAPDTEVLPDILASPEVAEGYRRGWEAGFRRRHLAASLVIYQLVKPRTMREGARRLLNYRDLRPVHSVYTFEPAASYSQLTSLTGRLFTAAMACTNKEHDKLFLSTCGLLAVLQAACARSPTEAVVRVLASGEGVKGSLRHGRKADWRGNGKQLFAAVVQQFRSWRAFELEKLHGLVVRDLSEYFLPEIDRGKARAAVADYNDLLFRAARLLRERPNARARLAERFDAVLIDEVQDTDPIQAEVAALLTRDPAASGEWDAHPPRSGRLFAVGDIQQSIYRFRRADQTTWRQLESLMVRDGEKLSLSENFRSAPGIVAWVNLTFRHLPGYQPQRAHREPAPLTPVVRLPLHPKASDLDELDAVVRYILELRRCAEVVDKRSGEQRPVVWSDIMLLLPSWAKADTLQDTLTRAGIPAVVEGGGSFFARDEIRLAIALLECVNEPGDEQSTVLVLRGLFGLTWEELAKHRAAGGAWRHGVPDTPEGPSLMHSRSCAASRVAAGVTVGSRSSTRPSSVAVWLPYGPCCATARPGSPTSTSSVRSSDSWSSRPALPPKSCACLESSTKSRIFRASTSAKRLSASPPTSKPRGSRRRS